MGQGRLTSCLEDTSARHFRYVLCIGLAAFHVLFSLFPVSLPTPFWTLLFLLSFVSQGPNGSFLGGEVGIVGRGHCGMRMLISKSCDPIRRINIWQTYATTGRVFGRKTWNVSIINAILNLSPARRGRGCPPWEGWWIGSSPQEAGLSATCHLF